MRIEILYVPGCPNYEPAVETLRALLESQSQQAEFRGVPISSEDQAKALLFPGAPTIRITEVSPRTPNPRHPPISDTSNGPIPQTTRQKTKTRAGYKAINFLGI